jgi:beta-fructofuranosidase
MARDTSLRRFSAANFSARKGSDPGLPTSWHVEGIIGNPQIRQANESYSRMLPATSFLRWRPGYHLMASHAWMNGPCAPGFDPATGLYHLSFQWNPRNNRWGHITWGHATSKDLISWDVPSSPILQPGAAYDNKGIFTGCMQPTGIDAKPGKLTVFYTSANHIPIHYSLPYKRGCETLSIAESKDGGKTWQKSPLNPILTGPPPDLDVCSWRDPFITPWETLDHALERSGTNNLYGLLSGGIRSRTPTVFLYAINPTNLAEWKFICPLINLGQNYHISRWSGNMGTNWDVANLITLPDDAGIKREFLVTGAEGYQPPPDSPPSHPGQAQRTSRSQQWLCGSLSTSSSLSNSTNVRLNPSFCGTFDHGCLYAANSFFSTIWNTYLFWGWIHEEDLPQIIVDSQNWSGLLSLPREVHLLRYQRVKSALGTPLNEISCFEVEPDEYGTSTVRTLGIVPARATEGLRGAAREVILKSWPLRSRREGDEEGDGESSEVLDVKTTRWELTCEIRIGMGCKEVGFVISHTPGKLLPVIHSFW